MIIYLHGFNSSPQSHKAQVLQRYMAERGLAGDYACPALPVSADAAIAAVDALMARRRGEGHCFVGSSLGGFYATWLVENRPGCKAVLINPAIDPHIGLRRYLGTQKNLYSGEEYQLTEAHLREWERRYVERISPRRYLLLVETGDEVLDYSRAVSRYAGAEQVVVEGGDHTLQTFPRHLPRILEFAGVAEDE
ncbi:MAG: YqiA/YcfP family alpha/beta fold hydrolase [Betaproteobacteria bacterium]